ncbi:MAG: fatty acid desaturase [Rhodanobacteraceae bacterium]
MSHASGGFTHAGVVAKLVFLLVMTQLTILTVTLYLHRSQSHRSVEFHPVLAHAFRFWAWLTTAMVTKEWVAIHRKHHAHCETELDPHSPNVHGIRRLLAEGAELYMDARADADLLAQFGQGTPDDWIERNLYSRRCNWGPTILAIAEVALFGVAGMAIWAIQMIWIPFWAAGVVNGVGHWWGYRNYETADRSTNLMPIGFWIGGEELHNNHHAFPSSARFALRRYEFDLGWVVIRVLSKFGLARVKRVARLTAHASGAEGLATLTPRVRLVTHFFRDVLLPAVRDETVRGGRARPSAWLRRALADGGRWLRPHELARFNAWLEDRPMIRTLSTHLARLDALLAERRSGRDMLDDWIRAARASDIETLRRFAAALDAESQTSSTLRRPRQQRTGSVG